MSDETIEGDQFPKLPCVIQDENSDFYFSEGHVEPYPFVLACLLDTAINAGAEEAFDIIAAGLGGNWSFASVEAFASEVQHVWGVVDDVNSDDGRWCDQSEEGARPFTRVAL